MARFDLAAARAAAVKALGRSAEKSLAALEAAGLSVVLTADLPSPEPQVRELHDVLVMIDEDWRFPWKVKVDHGGGVLVLHAAEEAVAGVREAVMVRQVMGGCIDVEVDEAEGLLRRAWVRP